MLESLFNKIAGLQLYSKEVLAQLLSCEICEMFKKTFFRARPVAISVFPPMSDKLQFFTHETLHWLFKKHKITYQNILEGDLVRADLEGKG